MTGVKIERQVDIEKGNTEQWKEFILTHVQVEKCTKQMRGGRYVRKDKCNKEEKEDRWNGSKGKGDIEKKYKEQWKRHKYSSEGGNIYTKQMQNCR